MDDHKPKYFAEHEVEDREHFAALATKEDLTRGLFEQTGAREVQFARLREELPRLVEESMISAMRKVGKISKTSIVTVAIVLGAVGVITGTLKAMLAWIGFQQISK